MKNNPKTFFEFLFQITDEVEGYPFQVGYIGNEDNPMAYVVYNQGEITVHKTKEASIQYYRKVLTDILKEFEEKPIETKIEQDLPW